MNNTPVDSSICALSDHQLVAQTKRLVYAERTITLFIIDHLREIEARCLHLRRGFSSLFDYAVTELGYSPPAASRRIKAMRLCSHTAGTRQLLAGGDLSLTAAAKLQHAFEVNRRRAAEGAVVQAVEVPAQAELLTGPDGPLPRAQQEREPDGRGQTQGPARLQGHAGAAQPAGRRW